MSEQKPTNPKDAIGSTKVPMDLVPETAVAEMATAFLEGALKYGKFNWRVKGVRASIYYAAARRHMMKWFNGEDEDEDTTVEHLASVMACCAIIIDAKVCGKLNDDRPPRAPLSKHLARLAKKVKHLQEFFKNENPHQYTIRDNAGGRVIPSDEVPAFIHPTFPLSAERLAEFEENLRQMNAEPSLSQAMACGGCDECKGDCKPELSDVAKAASGSWKNDLDHIDGRRLH